MSKQYNILVIILIAIIIVLGIWISNVNAYPVTQLYRTPIAPYEVSLNIPSFVHIEIVDRKGNWIELKVSWFNASYKGWVYI